jgi:hypothetical protein
MNVDWNNDGGTVMAMRMVSLARPIFRAHFCGRLGCDLRPRFTASASRSWEAWLIMGKYSLFLKDPVNQKPKQKGVDGNYYHDRMPQTRKYSLTCLSSGPILVSEY